METCSSDREQIPENEKRWLKIMRRALKNEDYSSEHYHYFPAVFNCTCGKHYFMSIARTVDESWCETVLILKFKVNNGGRLDYIVIFRYH